MNLKFLKKYITKNNMPFLIFTVLFFIAQCFVTLYPGDDTYFFNILHNSDYNLISFVSMRYNTWSGRITSEFLVGLFTLLPLWVWRILSTLIATTFLYLLSLIVLLPLKGTDHSKNRFTLQCFICLSFFMIPISVTSRACSWFTGSFFYLIPTLALLVALLPFIKQLYGISLTKCDYAWALLGCVFASFMEQTVAILLCFSLITLAYLFYKQKTLNKKLLPQILITVLCLILYELSPGNHLRFISETEKWYPEFATFSLVTKGINGLTWTHNHLVQDATWVMLILSMFAFTLAFPKLKSLYIRMIAFIPSLYFLGALIPFNRLTARTTSHEYNFDIQGPLDTFFFKPYGNILPTILSSLVLILLCALIIFSLGLNVDSLICFILFLALLCSGYVLGLSPTIFASGPRIFFITDILLVLISSILLKNILITQKLDQLLWKVSCIFYISLSGMFALIYIGGIAVKTLFKID